MYKIMLTLIILFVSFVLIFFLLPVDLILKYDKKIDCILRFGFLKINLSKFENKLNNNNPNKTQKKIKKSKININKSMKLAKLFKSVFVQIIKIKELDFVLNIGLKDAYNTAIKYGQACAVVYPLFRFIILKKKIKKYKISVNPNFNIFKTKFYFKINLRSNFLSMIVIILKIFGGNL